MQIHCPYCGLRDVSEYTYAGDGGRTRPEPETTDLTAWNGYVFERPNLAGDHEEIWQHSGGCRSHLAVTRNTLTHEIKKIAFSRNTPGDQQ